MLQNEGAFVAGYDPVAMPNAGKAVPNLRLAEDPYELAETSDALLVCTEWNEFKQLDLDAYQGFNEETRDCGWTQYL